MDTTTTTSKRVFINYAHPTEDWKKLELDPQFHRRRVFAFAQRLRTQGGMLCELDQYHETSPPVEGWPRWMNTQIKTSDFVLVVCTLTNYKRFLGEDELGVGLGSNWEGGIITQHLYEASSRNQKFIPVGFTSHSDNKDNIPDPLRSTNYYDVSTDEGFTDLLRHLTDQHKYIPAPLGHVPILPPEDDSTNPH